MNKINGFFNEFRFLSNMYEIEINYENIKYPSVEHAYQAAKTNDVRIKNFISNLKTGKEAKKYSKTIDIRKDWEYVKVDIMYNLLLLKFSNTNLNNMLQETKDFYTSERKTAGSLVPQM